MAAAPPSPDPLPTRSAVTGAAAAARPRRSAVRRLGRALWWTTLAALLVVGATALVAWRHEAVLPWLLQRVPGLQASGVQGTLATGSLRIAKLDWQLPGNAGRLQLWQLQVDGGRMALLPRPGVKGAVLLGRVQAARLQFDSAPPTGKPLQAPVDLHLPIDLRVDQLQIDEVQIDQWPLVQQARAALSLGAKAGLQHRIDDLSLTLEAGSDQASRPVQLSGSLAVATGAPLEVTADLQARRPMAPAWQGTLKASGPLARLAAEARLTGEARADAPADAAPPSLQARATLLPFAAWPLGALSLQTQALDLAALSAALPQTRLSGDAEIQTHGLDQPATAVITLVNALPGAWDTGRLPVQRLRLQASGEPRQTDRLVLDQFELQLANAVGAAGAAGRVTGQGRWLADTLALDLQIDQLLPARLHRSAAAISLGGPLKLRAQGLPLGPATAGAAPPTLALDGTLTGRWLAGGTAASRPSVSLRLVADGSARHLKITQAEARAGDALARLSGQAQIEAGGWRLRGQAALAHFDPRPWWPGAEGSAWRRGPHRLTAQAQANLLVRAPAGPTAPSGSLAIDRLLAAVNGDASIAVQDSQLAGVPVAGELRLHSAGPAAQVDGQLTLAGNRLTLQGQGGGALPADDRWHAVLKASDLARLAPLAPLFDALAPGSAAAWPRAGSLSAEVQTQGRWPALRSEGALQVQGLALTGLAVRSASLDWRHGEQLDDPMQVRLKAGGLRSGTQQIDQLTARLDGTLRSHAISLLVDSPVRPPAWAENLLGPAGSGTRLEAEARGQWQSAIAGAGSAGRYNVQGLQLQGGARDAQGGSRPWLAAQGLTGELLLGPTGALQSLQLAPGRVQLLSTALNWRELRWQAAVGAKPGAQPDPGRLDVAAELETIDLARLLARLQPEMGWSGNLTLGGRIEIHSADRLDADIVLERGSGDLSVTDDLGQTRALGLTDLRVALSAHDGLWQLAQGLAGRRVGTLAGAQVLRTTPERHWPPGHAPLQGVLEARVADLGVWGAWIPPGWRLSGALDTIAQFSGTLAAPQVNGAMRGSGLGVRNVLQGVSLSEGELALVLEGDNARIERFDFKGGDGQLTLTGGATLGAQPRATLRLVADHFRVLGRLDRRLVATGQANLALDAERLRLDGAFTVDEGLFDIGRGDAPALDADVTVTHSVTPATANGNGRGADNARPATPTPPVLRQAQVDLKIGLGEQLRLRGRGVDTGLRGDLQLSTPGGKLAINGTVRTQDGRYAAYGQKMEIVRGRFIFSGEPDNPRLDVLAIRPNLDVTVGVLVDGLAHNPRIRLYSEPEMAEYDKLSWLVMGRSPDGLGTADTALLQRAAFALLAGDTPGPTDQLLDAIGLTDFSLRQTEGTTRDTIVTLGKQLSRRWYVGYERSMQATTGTWQLIYRIAQRFTLRAQSGAENAVDLIWSWRW
ncbi:MAG: hypothetical protein A3E25_21750 [Burkholderiales bacterium RIFCSPHIGHO2_12_FULL_69_20]|nr:MAG: hypothetical protein A3E25_21750 [Burkholderiales bacterium RIFCSPHIGHO2_12_FULL_69_20]